MATSKIEWTDTTWNPVTGCTAVSPGCTNCYAATMTRRLAAMGQPEYQGLVGATHFNGNIKLHPDRLEAPLHWRKPRRVFVNSMSDLFHEGVPLEFIDRVFAMMALCPRHEFQVLTKRPENAYSYLHRRVVGTDSPSMTTCDVVHHIARGFAPEHPVQLHWPLPNVWLGTSAEDQPRLDERVPHLLRCPAAVRFLSLEPLLGPIPRLNLDGIHWVIVGCESGPKRRPCDVKWVRDIVQQCAAAGVACFVKQMAVNGEVSKNPADWPKDLRVREYPKGR